MKREVIGTGASIEDAIADGRRQLGIGEDAEVSTDIIDVPEKKILGLFGGKPARVTVIYDDGKPAPKAPRAEKKPQENKPVQKAEKPEKREPVAINKASLDRTVEFVKNILTNMNIGEFECEVSDIDGGFCIDISGDGAGSVIGRRGETLDAIQYLASLCYNNDEDGFVRVVIDTNNYRAKREETLTALAKRVAERAQRTGHNQALEPMNPYERRVIHTAIQGIEGMTSWSVSDSRGRRVIIGAADDNGKPISTDVRPPRSHSDRGYRSGKGGRGGRGARSTSATPAPSREKHSDASDLPLFGRIDK